MRKNNWIALPLLFNSLLVLSSCVTVNVNIPESAVQEASDDYVRDLYQAKEKSKPAKAPAPGPTASPPSMLDLIVSSAFADDRIVKTDSAKAQQIREREAARHDEIVKLKSSGILGETNDGQLVIKLKSAIQKIVQKLVADENADRTELYKEIVAHNGLAKAHLETVQRNFARSFQKYSPAKTWIQDEAGEWTQKP